MRIILAALNFPGVGGVESSIENLASAFEKLGYRVAIVSFSPTGAPEHPRQIVVRRSWMFKLLRVLLTGSIAAVIAFRQSIREAFPSDEDARASLVIARHPAVAVAFSLSGFERIIYLPPASMEQFYDGVLRELSILRQPLQHAKMRVLRAVDVTLEGRLISDCRIGFITFSDHLASYFAARGKEATRIEPGVDPSLLTAIPEHTQNDQVGTLAMPDQEPLKLIYVGRLEPGKNLNLLLTAVRDCSEEVDVRCTIVGGGTLYLPLQRVYGESIFRFVGPKPKGEIAELLGAADFLVLPTYNEGFGQVLLEALVCGTPVLGFSSQVANTATDQVVATDLFGLRVENTGAAALKDAILRASEHAQAYRKMRRILALEARRRFSWQAFAENVIAISVRRWQGK